MKASAKETAEPVFVPVELTLEIESLAELGGLSKMLLDRAMHLPNELAANDKITEEERIILSDLMIAIGQELDKFMPK